MLDRHVAKFRAADTKRREKIVKNAAEYIKSTWAEGAEFNRDAVKTACELSDKFTLGYSHILLAYSRIHVRQSKT
jgi:hypothetical protein